MDIRNSELYKQTQQLAALHDGYGKHSCKQKDDWNTHRCDGCGMPFNEGTGKTDVGAIYNMLGSATYKWHGPRKQLAKISDEVFVLCLETLLGIPVEERNKGISYYRTSDNIINLKLQQVKDRYDIGPIRKWLVNDAEITPPHLYLLAKEIDGAPSADIFAKLQSMVMAKNKNIRQTLAETMLAWHKHFKTTPTKAEYKALACGFSNYLHRHEYARLAKQTMAMSVRWRGKRSALASYYLIKDLAPNRFKNVEYMRKTYGADQDCTLLYYRDTGQIIGELDSFGVAIKSRLIDKRPEPTPEERALMGADTYQQLYAKEADLLDIIPKFNDTTWYVRLCTTYEDYLLRNDKFSLQCLSDFKHEVDGLNGFAPDEE